MANASRRHAEVRRATGETNIHVEVDLDSDRPAEISTGVGFFDHMLHALAKHGRFELHVVAKGDLEVDAHHTVEDVGICLGQAIRKALGNDLRIRRFASAYAPLDEALSRCVIDISGRSFLYFGAEFSRPAVGEFETELVEEFFRAFVSNARITLHVDLIRGQNTHHQIESLFKATALACRQAWQRENLSSVPSTKGVLTESAARGDASAPPRQPAGGPET